MAHKGRGWHGDSEGHARAGRKGGKASSRRMKKEERIALAQADQMDDEEKFTYEGDRNF